MLLPEFRLSPSVAQANAEPFICFPDPLLQPEIFWNANWLFICLIRFHWLISAKNLNPLEKKSTLSHFKKKKVYYQETGDSHEARSIARQQGSCQEQSPPCAGSSLTAFNILPLRVSLTLPHSPEDFPTLSLSACSFNAHGPLYTFLIQAYLTIISLRTNYWEKKSDWLSSWVKCSIGCDHEGVRLYGQNVTAVEAHIFSRSCREECSQRRQCGLGRQLRQAHSIP